MLYKYVLLLTLKMRFNVVRAPLGPKWTISTRLGVDRYMIYFCFSEILYLIHKLSKISYDWLETVYENHKINCKIFQHPMEKIFITLWDV